MASQMQFPLALVVKAVDEATGPLRAMAAKLHEMGLGGIKKAIGEFSKAAGFGKVLAGFSGVGAAVRNVGQEAFALGSKLFAIAGVAGWAFFSIIKGAMESGDQLATMADRVGLTVDAYASLQHAANLADVDQESFNTAMDKFNKNMGEMTAGKGGEFLAFLNEVSPALAKQMKAAHGTEEALSLMTDAFQRIKDPAKSAALSTHAFGKSGAQMGRFMNQGRAVIQAQQREYMRLVGSQQAFAAGADDLDSTLKNTELAFTGLRNTVATAFFPALSSLAKLVTEFLVANREGIAKWAKDSAKALQAWIDSGGFDRLVSWLGSVKDAISGAIEFVGGFKNALGLVALFMAGPLISAIVGVIPAVYSLGAALLTTPVGWFLLAVAAIAFAVWAIYDNWDGITAFFQIHFAAVKDILKGFSDIVLGIVTFDLARVFNGWTQALQGFRSELGLALVMLNAIPGGSLAFNALGGWDTAKTLLMNGSQPSLGAAGAAPIMSQEVQSTEAKIRVDFSGMPRGARVSTDTNSSQPIDMSVGYSMVSP